MATILYQKLLLKSSRSICLQFQEEKQGFKGHQIVILLMKNENRDLAITLENKMLETQVHIHLPLYHIIHTNKHAFNLKHR